MGRPIATGSEPCLVIETDGIDDQPVSVPICYGVPMPCGMHIFGMSPPIQENLPPAWDFYLAYRD
jgi:hypothetical protein